MRPAYRLYQLAWSGLDWFYPPFCGGCGKRGERWCPECQGSIEKILPPVCQRCGQHLAGNEVCPNCRDTRFQFSALRSWAVFNGSIRNAIHRLKYKGDMALGEALARPLIKLLVELGWCVDLVTPVPLGVARLSQRGYNQAALLARPLSLAHGLPYHTNALTKVRETRSQVGLSANERHQNVADAFKGDPRVSKGKCILVIDDVTTSGATLNACASALLQAGASRVYGLTLARTSSRPADRDAG